MTRRLKTFVTSIGFYDLAVAAPSMKAALEAWDVERNLFHQGLAGETTDQDIVAATLDHPGVVLRRPVGSRGAYKEKPDAPRALPIDVSRPVPKARARKRPAPKPAKTSRLDPGVQKAGIIEFEAARKRSETQRQHEEAQRRKEKAAAERELDRRRGALEKAQTMRDRARERHEAKLAALEKERDAVDTRIAAEQEHWKREEKDLDRAIARAKD